MLPVAGADRGGEAEAVGAGAFSAEPLSPEQATVTSNKANKTLKVLFILYPFSFNERGICKNTSEPPKRSGSGQNRLSNLITAPGYCKLVHNNIF